MQQSFNPGRHRIGRTLCVLLSLITVATAESEDATPQSVIDDDYILDEIIVTAQKRQKAAQDVPISVSVFSDVDVEAMHLANVGDIARYTPNLEWDQSFLGASNSSSIFIRGVGQAANFAEHSTDPGVGVYLDGVYIGRGVGSALAVLDVSQIEVLRGPQGTLFGKNATGGAVTLVTNRPTGAHAGWVDVTTGSDSRSDLRLVANLPVTDRIWTRFSASSLNQDSNGKSLQDGTEFGEIDTDAVRGALRWLVRDDLTIDFIADWSRTREASPTNALVFANADPLASLTGAFNFFVAPSNTVEGFGNGVPWDSRFVTPGNFTSFATGKSGSDLDTQGVTAIVAWRPGDLTFTSTTAYRDMDSQWAMDVDLSPLTIIEDIIALDQDQFSQEFTLQGRHDSLDWLVGLYYFNEEASAFGGAIIVPELATVEFHPFFGVPNPLFGRPLSTPGVAASATPLVNDHRARSVAVFTHLDYGFSERLSGFAGLRYTSEEKRVKSPPGLVASNGDSETFTEASPTLGLQYFVDEGMQLYGSVSRGFKSGGFNTLVILPRQDFLPYAPEEVTSYELGFKASRDRYSVAVAAFFADYEDIQIAVLNDVEPQTLNAAEAEIKGWEFELVAALTPDLRLRAGVGYLNAEYTKLDETGLAGLVIPVTLDSKLMDTPEWSVNLNLVYSTDLQRIGRLTLRGDYSWRDKAYKDAINTAELAQDAFGLLHAGATLVSENRQWELTLFGDNLTDETYIRSGVANKPSFGLAFANFARGRTWGLSVRYRFGSEDMGQR